MPRYAQINTETGLVEGDSFLRDSGMEKHYSELISISDDFDLTNKKYDFELKVFVDYISD